MEAAAASFEQVPPNGAGATGTLTDFATAAGIAESSLHDYRRVWLWLDRDSAHVRRIPSYSTALLAMSAKFPSDVQNEPQYGIYPGGPIWANATEFTKFTEDEDPPAPYKTWTVDALRVHPSTWPLSRRYGGWWTDEDGNDHGMLFMRDGLPVIAREF